MQCWFFVCLIVFGWLFLNVFLISETACLYSFIFSSSLFFNFFFFIFFLPCMISAMMVFIHTLLLHFHQYALAHFKLAVNIEALPKFYIACPFSLEKGRNCHPFHYHNWSCFLTRHSGEVGKLDFGDIDIIVKVLDRVVSLIMLLMGCFLKDAKRNDWTLVLCSDFSDSVASLWWWKFRYPVALLRRGR